MTTQKITQLTSYLLMAFFLIGCFSLHLMSTLVSGLSLYLLVTHFYKMIVPKMKSEIAGKITLLMLIFLLIIVLGGIFFGIYSAIKVGNANIKSMGEDAFNILQEIRSYLPESIVSYIPDDMLILKEKLTEVAKLSSSHIFEVTGSSLKVLVHVVLGLLLGAIIAFSFLKDEVHSTVFYINQKMTDIFNKYLQKKNEPLTKEDIIGLLSLEQISEEDKKSLLEMIENHNEKESRPLKEALTERIKIFAEVFRKVISAQVKISAINTILTSIYLLIALPLCGIHLPYAKTLVLITFLVGLIPVLGNLISNVLIFLISLTVGFKVAIASIVFLIIIHKMEYYINAKIVGEKIKISIWELLLAMLVMETLFGLMGVALAPVIYGYIKEELKLKKLI